MSPPISSTITYGEKDITYDIIFSDRKTLDISVHPNAQVIVTAPHGANLETVHDKVQHRAHWILKQQRYFSQFEPRTPPRQYISGETHRYLGRQYRLKVQEDPNPSVKLIGPYFHIRTPHPENSEVVRELLDGWYLTKAEKKFNERLDCCFERFSCFGFTKPAIAIRRLSKRWGSLTAKGRMTLNLKLIQAPTLCIDYVITHELCHLKHPDHSHKFYSYLEHIMPDWQTRKTKLEQVMI